MSIETVLTCPLGSKCEEVKDGKIHRCAWFTKLNGKNPSTGELVDEHGCAMTWLPILLIENATQARGFTAAIESFRNEVVNPPAFRPSHAFDQLPSQSSGYLPR